MKRNLQTSCLALCVLLSMLFWIPAVTWGQRGRPSGNSPGASPVNRPALGSRPAPSARPAPSSRPAPSARPAPSSRPAPSARPAPSSRPAPSARPAPSSRPAPSARPASSNRPSSPSRLEIGGRPSSRPESATSNRPVSRPVLEMTGRPAQRPGSGSTADHPGSRPTRPDFDRPPQRPGSGSTADRPGSRPTRPDFDRPPQRPGSGSTADRPGSRPTRPDFDRPPQHFRPDGYRPDSPSRPPHSHYGSHQHHYHHPAPPPPPRPGPRYYYPYDPYRYYGWGPVYRPYYPWWIGAANFGAGFAVGYTVGARPLYYYYPDYVVTSPATTVVIENNTVVQEAPTTEEIWNPSEDILEDVENPTWEKEESIQLSKPVSVLNRDLDLSNNTDLSKITKEMVDDSWKLIQEGDTRFSAGEVRKAIQDYNKVIETVPVMPDPWFRLAFAEVSENDYNAAMEHCLKGMELSRNWPASPFSLDYMYQENQTKKGEDLNLLEKAVRTAPDNSDLNMLAGMAFYSDGQSEKAVQYLTKAKKLMPDLVDFVDPMLKNIEESGKKEGEK